jgi:hypothetical protein
MRGAIAVVVVMLVAASAAADGVAEKLVDSYGTRAGYRAVRRDVLSWHKTTKNGCVAFASTALRRIGVDVPRDASRLTLPLSEWLETHGWTRVTDPAALLPGDLVFTERPEFPWHVFVFHSWSDRDRRIARALDNIGFLAARPVLGDAERDITPMAYALRAP